MDHHSAGSPPLLICRERGTRSKSVDQGIGILDPLTRTLPKERHHCVRRITEQGDASLDPLPHHGQARELTAMPLGRRGVDGSEQAGPPASHAR